LKVVNDKHFVEPEQKSLLDAAMDNQNVCSLF